MKKFIFRFYALASLFLFPVLFSNTLLAQETESSINFNPLLFYSSHKQTKFRSIDTLHLPFMDDFSYPIINAGSKYPDASKWEDRDVYINTTFPVSPPSIGVATFDGLNEFGIPYDTTGVVTPEPCDSLTSLPIHLETFDPSDSLYLSFFYEKMGRGDYPNVGDKLFLECRKNDGTWQTEWMLDGDASATVAKFYQVLIPITDPGYYYNAFQFRFRNIATASGNNDHWHLDYVRLDSSRAYNDTILSDIAAVYTPSTILKHYESMPWNQFKNFQSTDLRNSFEFEVRNNLDQPQTVLSSDTASELISSLGVFPYATSTYPFTAFSNQIWFDTTDIINANLLDDSAIVLINCKATTQSSFTDINRLNDSAFRIQRFFNYYAHDDGSAEKAYGLNQAGARLAVHFQLNVADTLRAVQYHFAHIDQDLSDKLFSLMVWDSISSNPSSEHLIYEQDFLRPDYIDSINGFATYILDTPKAISGNFYVGMLQSYANFYNIGFDKNTDSHTSNYFNVNGVWNQSTLPGSLMIRPVVGAKLPFTAIRELKSENFSVTCYPNPVSDLLNIRIQNITNYQVQVSDLMGRQLIRFENQQSVNVSSLTQGIYFLTVTDPKTEKRFTTRFIKM